MPICGASWGSTEAGWTWCCLAKEHAGSCQDWQGKPPSAPFFHDQPEAAAFIAKQHADEDKKVDKKACKKALANLP